MTNQKRKRLYTNCRVALETKAKPLLIGGALLSVPRAVAYFVGGTALG
jgi:hypothetical protein